MCDKWFQSLQMVSCCFKCLYTLFIYTDPQVYNICTHAHTVRGDAKKKNLHVYSYEYDCIYEYTCKCVCVCTTPGKNYGIPTLNRYLSSFHFYLIYYK